MISSDTLLREAERTGFQTDSLEKVVILFEILESLRSHPFLKERLVLKGGTALNAFVLRLPRLSVDIDLNYIGSIDREVMLSEKPRVEQAVEAVCSRLGIRIKYIPMEHAGGKWQLSYESGFGRLKSLEMDINFLLRTPLWPYVIMDSRPVGSFQAKRIPVLDRHELAAGKLSALFSRRASRDIFDACNVLRYASLDPARLRLAFIVYGGTNRRDWREISLDDVVMGPNDVANQLVPMLQQDLAPEQKQAGIWVRKLVQECRKLLSGLLPLRENEREFLALLNDRGEIAPELLTGDARMRTIIARHPALRWKARNVREYRKSLSPESTEDF